MSAFFIGLGGVLCVGIAVAAIVIGVGIMRGRTEFTTRSWTAMYYGFVPLGGLVATAAFLITNYLYLWTIFIAPLVFILLPMRQQWLRYVFPVLSAVLVITSVAISVAPGPRLAHYADYQNAETRCLDAKLPKGMDVGYADYFDARRLELTATRPIRLIPIDYTGNFPYFWLTNRSYFRGAPGQFFYVNTVKSQTAITVGSVVARWGQPSTSFSCGTGHTVLVYTDPSTLAKVQATYAAPVN